MIYQIFYFGHDITKYVIDMPSIPMQKGELGQVIELPNLSISVENGNGEFTPGGLNSFLVGNWEGKPVKVYLDASLIYDGILKNVTIQNNGRVIGLETTNKVNEILNASMPIYYHSVDTIAEISKDIYQSFGISVDTASYNKVIAEHTRLGFQVEARISPTAQQTVLGAQQWLMNAGMCRQWFETNKAYIEFVDPTVTYVSSAVIQDKDILEVQDFRIDEIQKYDGYQVNTGVGTYSQSGNNIAPILEAGPESNFTWLNPSGAINYGQNQVMISNIQSKNISLQVIKGSQIDWVDIDGFFTVQSIRLNLNTTFRVLSIDKSNRLYTVVSGVTL